MAFLIAHTNMINVSLISTIVNMTLDMSTPLPE